MVGAHWMLVIVDLKKPNRLPVLSPAKMGFIWDQHSIVIQIPYAATKAPVCCNKDKKSKIPRKVSKTGHSQINKWILKKNVIQDFQSWWTPNKFPVKMERRTLLKRGKNKLRGLQQRVHWGTEIWRYSGLFFGYVLTVSH